MTERRRRRLRRDALVFLGSIVFHVGLFFIAVSEFNFYNLPQENAPAVQVEIVPPTVEPIPPMPPIVQPTTQPTQPPPSPQTQPQQKPQPPKPVPTPAPPQPAAAPTAPAQAVHAPTPLPAPKPAPSLAPTPLAPPAPTAGPPKAAPQVSVAAPQTHAVAAPHIVLHKSREAGTPLEPGLNLPGATFAPPPQAAAPGGGAPSGAGGPPGGGLPGGRLPAFGSGLRGGPLGCANAAVLHLTPEEQARCDEAFGEGALQSPRMDPIGSSKRQLLDSEAAQEEAARKYRDSMPAGSAATPTPGQPKILQTPGH
jgi:hypothetical protein